MYTVQDWINEKGDQFTEGYQYQNISTSGNHTIKSGAGKLQRIIINKLTALSVITIYDNVSASGSKIGTITQPVALLASQLILPYEVNFLNGLTINLSTNDDITVIYK